MSKLLHPLPLEFDVLAQATISLENQYSIIHAIDVARYPELKKLRKDTLNLFDFEFKAINSDIEFINLHVTKPVKLKAGSHSLVYPAYISSLERCTELFIHMEKWVGWRKSTTSKNRTSGVAKKFSQNDLICKNHVTISEKKLGRSLIGSDYLAWKRQLIAACPNPPVTKAPRNLKINGTPLKPITGAPVLTTTKGWKESTLRNKFEEFTGYKPTTKKVSQLK
jgi:hypothetical protein